MSEQISAGFNPQLQELSFHVAGKPLSQNRAWTIITWKSKDSPHAHGSLKLTDEGAAFKAEIGRVAALVRPPDWDRENQYIVSCTYYFPTLAGDVDGPGKLVLDALKDFEVTVNRKPISFVGLFRDDSKVWRFIQQKEKDAENPRTEITVRLRNAWRPQQRPLL